MRSILTALILLILAAPAQATVNQNELSTYLTIASHYWDEQIDCVQTHTDRKMVALARADLGLPDWSQSGTTGQAPILPACDIWINPREWKRARHARRCDAIVHEYGHLLGHKHTRGDNTIMDPLRLQVVLPCHHPVLWANYYIREAE